jgi:hypothetical protein
LENKLPFSVAMSTEISLIQGLPSIAWQKKSTGMDCSFKTRRWLGLSTGMAAKGQTGSW